MNVCRLGMFAQTRLSHVTAGLVLQDVDVQNPVAFVVSEGWSWPFLTPESPHVEVTR